MSIVVFEHMFIQGNLIGVGMFLIAGIVVAFGYFLLKLPDLAVMISGTATVIIVDLISLLIKK